MSHSFKESWRYSAEFIYCMDLGCGNSCSTASPASQYRVIWQSELKRPGFYKTLPNSKFHLDNVWQTCVCSQPARKRYSTLNSCWNSAGQKCPEMVDEGEKSCGLCCWAHCGGDASTAYGKSSTASQTDKSIWVLAQLELDASETMATWIAEAMLSFCVWIWWTYWPSKKATVLKSRQPRQCRCLLAGQFNHCCLPTARMLSSNGWGNGTRLCVWEGAALVK